MTTRDSPVDGQAGGAGGRMGRIEYVRPADGRLLYTIEIDERTGLLRTMASGFWTMEEFEIYNTAIATQLAVCRTRFGRLRVLSDLTGSVVQSQSVASEAQESFERQFGPDDRLAIIVNAQMVKGQWERRYPFPNFRAFNDAAEAERWVLEP